MKQPIPFGNYYLMDLIAKGGMAEVFKAKYLGPEGFSKVVAVKRILPELAEEQDFIRMFIDEAKIASQLNHANITGILQLGEAHGTYFIAMEFVQGKDLRTIYERSRREHGVPPSPLMAAFVMSRVCEGIDYAHRRRGDTGKHLGIIHRDVSPQNVIVSYEGDVKLIDFGIAKAQDKLVKTEAGILKGKYCYMSPEQVRGLDIDHRSDIFGLGVVLHEILTRQRLFLGSNDLKTLENVLKQPIEPPSTINPAVPPALDEITMRALSRDVGMRYQFASEMHEDLQRFLYSQPTVFSRRELSQYMNGVFGEDLDKELRRQASYEPFFEALPNTPMPSAMHISTSSTALSAMPPILNTGQFSGQGGYQQPSPDSNPGSYFSGISQPATSNALNAEVTSYSGPHPHPMVGAQQTPAMASPAQAPSAFPMSNPTASMVAPPGARMQPAAPAAQSGGVQFFPGGYYNQPTPPAAPPPSYMFGSDSDDEEEEEDEPTVLETSSSKERKNKPPPPTLAMADEIPTRQLSYSDALASVQQVQMPSPPAAEAQHFSAPTEAIQQPHFGGTQPLPYEEILQPLAPTQPPADQYYHPEHDAEPTQLPQVYVPAASSAPTTALPSYDDLEEGTETLMQGAINKSKRTANSSSSLKGWVIALGVMAMLLVGGLIGAYTYRCQLFQMCPPVEQTYYTLVFATPANGVDILLNGKQIPPHKLTFLGPHKIRLSFSQEGTYMLEVRKSGCLPLRNKIRIIKDMEVETPRLPLQCPQK